MSAQRPGGWNLPETGQPPDGGELVVGEAVQLEIRVARVGSRVLALLVDIVVQVALLALLSFLVGLLVTIAGIGEIDSALGAAISVVVLALVLIGYPVTVETITGGRSAGKLALGLRVVREDGGPIRFRHALTRSLVSVAVEWPGLVLPLATWAASLTTMLANPRSRRLGDLAAGTLVIHERTPEGWGWVPSMPPALATWAGTLDLTGLPDDLALAVRHFLARNRAIVEPHRSRLGYQLAAEVAALTTPTPPPWVPGWMYLAAVIAERHRRATAQLVKARSAAAQVWPELAWHAQAPLPALAPTLKVVQPPPWAAAPPQPWKPQGAPAAAPPQPWAAAPWSPAPHGAPAVTLRPAMPGEPAVALRPAVPGEPAVALRPAMPGEDVSARR